MYGIAIDCKRLLNKCVQLICNYAHKLKGVGNVDGYIAM